jgi:hypothetical protein
MMRSAAAIRELHKELGETTAAPIGTFCLSAAPVAPEESAPEIPNLLFRTNALLAQGGDVLLFRKRELYNHDDPRESLHKSSRALRRWSFAFDPSLE